MTLRPALVSAVAAVATAGLCLSCSGAPVADRAPRAATASAAPGPSGSAAGDAPTGEPTWPATPSAARPAVLADQLGLVGATLRDDASTRDARRRAGEFQQLALRVLADARPAVRRRVLADLGAGDARVVRAALSAVTSLRGLTAPQRRLPRWRIVAPPAPAVLLRHYREAQRRTGVPWEYLAAIHLTETRMGRIRGTSTAGAQGPMQFLPSTWAIYGAGGDIDDPRDAILAAARLLKAGGAPRRMAAALYRYNPSDLYVRAVSAYARSMRQPSSARDWAYTGYWQWRVLYRHVKGTYVLPVGYPRVGPELLAE